MRSLRFSGTVLNKRTVSYVSRYELNLGELMNTKFTALALITASALSLAPKPAAANDKGLAIAGGFLGGLIVASAINDSRHDNNYDQCNNVVVADRCEDRRDAGFWKEVSVQVWVPGVWIVERNFYGRNYRRYVGGHYECRNNRVWVANERYDRNDRRHHDNRDNGRGYGHNR